MDKIQEIQNAFKEVGLSVEAIYEIEKDEILVCISWGDWKHEHLACKQVMKTLGYFHVQEVVTEDNGSDCYSAEHTFINLNRYIPFVRAMAKRYASDEAELQELMMAGTLGLIEGAGRYNKSIGYSFISQIALPIRRSILSYIEDKKKEGKFTNKLGGMKIDNQPVMK